MKQRPNLSQRLRRSLQCGIWPCTFAILISSALVAASESGGGRSGPSDAQRAAVLDLIGLTTERTEYSEHARNTECSSVMNFPEEMLSVRSTEASTDAQPARSFLNVVNVTTPGGAADAALQIDSIQARDAAGSDEESPSTDLELADVTMDVPNDDSDEAWVFESDPMDVRSPATADNDIVVSIQHEPDHAGHSDHAGHPHDAGTQSASVVVRRDPIAEPVPDEAILRDEPTIDNSVTPLESRQLGPPPEAGPTVQHQAERLIESGILLARRGAVYTSRARFIRALRLVTQAFDAQSNTRAYSDSLARGLVALDEARDFRPEGSRLEADLSIPRIVRTHRTKLLHDVDVQAMTPLVAMQQYHEYAEQQLVIAGGRERVAADALFALGRLQNHLSRESGSQESTGDANAMSLYQTALLINPDHHLAGNELGVLFARYGQYRDARAVFRHCVKHRRNFPEVWRNLAHVHEHLGEFELAKLAQEEFVIASGSGSQSDKSIRPQVQWVDPATFAAASRDSLETKRDHVMPQPPVKVTKRQTNSSLPSTRHQPLSVGQRIGR